MAAKRVPITLWLDASDLAAMRGIRSRTGVPVVAQVRRAVKLAMPSASEAARRLEAPSRRRGGFPQGQA